MLLLERILITFSILIDPDSFDVVCPESEADNIQPNEVGKIYIIKLKLNLLFLILREHHFENENT